MALQTLEWPSVKSDPVALAGHTDAEPPDMRFSLVFSKGELYALKGSKQTRDSSVDTTFSSLSHFDFEPKHNQFPPLFSAQSVQKEA
jgi:hypothetical protein